MSKEESSTSRDADLDPATTTDTTTATTAAVATAATTTRTPNHDHRNHHHNHNDHNNNIQCLRVLEFFSGIGGMRCALEQALLQQQQQSPPPSSSSIDDCDDDDKNGTRTTQKSTRTLLQLKSCHAYEINGEANQVYRRNFHPDHSDGLSSDRSNDNNNNSNHHDIPQPNSPSSSNCTKKKKNKSKNHQTTPIAVSTKLVEQLSVVDVAGQSELWTLSPPCQPFTNTRFAKQRDLEDKRNKGLLALLQLLEQLAVQDYSSTTAASFSSSSTTTTATTTTKTTTTTAEASGSTNHNHKSTTTTSHWNDDSRNNMDMEMEKAVVQARPYWILLENVQGFVPSQMRTQVLLPTLERCGYSWKEYLLSPMQLDIPNHRTRYYILCQASDRFFPRTKRRRRERQQQQRLQRLQLTTVPPSPAITSEATALKVHENDNSVHDDGDDDDIHNPTIMASSSDENICCCFPERSVIRQKLQPPSTTTTRSPSRTIGTYLDDPETVDWNLYGLDHDTLQQPWARRELPLVGPDDTHSHCFTAFYSRQVHSSTGSLLFLHPQFPSVSRRRQQPVSQTTTTITTTNNNNNNDHNNHSTTLLLDRSDMTQYVGQIRKFTPSELLRLFGFPATFTLDDKDNDDNDKKDDNNNKSRSKQGLRLQTKYKLIGNSINVTVVSILLEYLLLHDDDDEEPTVVVHKSRIPSPTSSPPPNKKPKNQEDVRT